MIVECSIYPLTSPMISANSLKSGSTVCGGNGVNVHPYVYPPQKMVFNHLLIHHRRRCSTTLHIYDMEMGCSSLNGYVASDIV